MKPKHSLPPWLKPKQPGPDVIMCVGWYAEPEWGKVKAAATDPERFEATFREWVEMAEDSIKQMSQAGMKVQKCYLRAEDLLAWCLAHGKPNNAASRAEYASQLGRSMSKGDPV